MVFKSIFEVAGDTARTPLALEPVIFLEKNVYLEIVYFEKVKGSKKL